VGIAAGDSHRIEKQFICELIHKEYEQERLGMPYKRKNSLRRRVKCNFLDSWLAQFVLHNHDALLTTGRDNSSI